VTSYSYACCDDYPHICRGCGLVMSHREATEQATCNECAETGVDVDWPPELPERNELADYPPADAYRRGPGYRGP
jgi:hypothetical protein